MTFLIILGFPSPAFLRKNCPTRSLFKLSPMNCYPFMISKLTFKCDVERQRCTEFTREQRKQYDEVYGKKLDEQFKKSTNPDADSKKRERTTGDI